MARKKTAKPGDFVQIPLEDGTFGYAKLLTYETGFLDLQTKTTEVTQADLEQAKILFRIPVMQYAFKPRSPWSVVGHLALTVDEQRASKFCKKDAINGKLSIYQKGDEYPMGYIEYPATYEDCKDLERAAVWDPHHVESRLLDHFNGRKNVWVEQLSLKPE